MNNDPTPSGWNGGVSLKVNGGVVLDGYQLLRPIGQGGYGQVWLARMVATGELCAFKWIGNPVAVAREMKAVVEFRTRSAELAGVALCPIQHVGKLDDNLFYVMPLADGRAPGSALEEGWRPRDLEGEVVGRLQGIWFSSAEIIGIAAAICRAASALESVGLVHRDIKLGNVMYFRGKPCLADLGLVTLDDTRLSARGTPGFAAPSWYVESGGNPDMWGVCCVLFGLLTGHAPDKLGRTNYRWPPCGEAGLDAGERQRWLDLHRVILTGTSDDPLVRYRGLSEMAVAIELVGGVVRGERGRVGVGWMPLAGAGLLFAGISVGIFLSREPRGRESAPAVVGTVEKDAPTVEAKVVLPQAGVVAEKPVKRDPEVKDAPTSAPVTAEVKVAAVPREMPAKAGVVSADGDASAVPKDRANVFWKAGAPLFDLLTDEPIVPEKVGDEEVYKIFYTSAESRVPGYTQMTANQLSEFFFYKFKTLKSCEDWCFGVDPKAVRPEGVAGGVGKVQGPQKEWLRYAGVPLGTAVPHDELVSMVMAFWVRQEPELIAGLKARAERGDGAAMGELATRYRSGMGVYVDPPTSHRYAKMAAETGDPLGLWGCALMHKTGFGAAKDPASFLRLVSEALPGLTRLAEEGNRFAKNALANIYFEGSGVERDDARAWKLFGELAQLNDANSMNSLSVQYAGNRNPSGVRDDRMKIYWCARAIEAGSLDALLNLGNWFLSGSGVSKNPRLWLRCIQKAAEAGDIRLMHDVAMSHVEGKLIPTDIEMANYWLEQGVIRGCSRSMVTYGTHLQGGWGMKIDKERGADYILKGALAGELTGILNMGKITQGGIGVPMDQKAAFEWFLKAANLGSPHGYRELAKCYREGLGTAVDAEKAIQMLEQAARIVPAR